MARFTFSGQIDLGARKRVRNTSVWGQLTDRVRHLVLPMTTLAVIGIAGIARFARGSILDVQHQPFVSSGRSRGLTTRSVQVRYIVRNALIPIVTLRVVSSRIESAISSCP